MTHKVDPKTLTDHEIKEAISYHCRRMGSMPYYYGDEIERWRADPSCLTVFRDEDGNLRAYTHLPRGNT
jgi:hypothetical protein